MRRFVKETQFPRRFSKASEAENVEVLSYSKVKSRPSRRAARRRSSLCSSLPALPSSRAAARIAGVISIGFGASAGSTPRRATPAFHPSRLMAKPTGGSNDAQAGRSAASTATERVRELARVSTLSKVRQCDAPGCNFSASRAPPCGNPRTELIPAGGEFPLSALCRIMPARRNPLARARCVPRAAPEPAGCAQDSDFDAMGGREVQRIDTDREQLRGARVRAAERRGRRHLRAGERADARAVPLPGGVAGRTRSVRILQAGGRDAGVESGGVGLGLYDGSGTGVAARLRRLNPPATRNPRPISVIGTNESACETSANAAAVFFATP